MILKSVKPNILQSSCAPLLFIIRLTGIPLDYDHSNHYADSLNHAGATKKNVFIHFQSFFALFMFFINIENNLIYAILVVDYLFDWKNKAEGNHNSNTAYFSITYFWNGIIEVFNLIFLTFGTHLTLLATTLVRWPDLVRFLHRLDREFHLNPELHYKQFRYMSIATFLYWMMLPLSMAILIVKPILSNPTIDSWIKLILTLNHALVIYPNSAGVLFLSLAWVTAKCLQVFSERIEEKANQVGVGRQTVLINIQKNDEDERMVDEWKRLYLLIDHLVEEINRSFGFPLLIIFTSVIVRIINNLFSVMVSFDGKELDEGYNGRIHFLLMDFFGIMLAAYVSHRIKEEGVSLTNQLRRIHFDDHFLHTKVNFLVMELSHSPLRITACGLFTVDLRIVLSLIGSTITYLIILWQFQMSEKVRSY